MAQTVFEMAVVWDGTHLIANRRYGEGWRQLTGQMPAHPPNVSTPCTELEDLTPFELGLFLAVACRTITDSWYDGQPALIAVDDQAVKTRAAG